MHMKLFRYLIACGAGLAIALPAVAVTLTLKSNAVATRPYVALHEIAEISGLARPGLLPELQRLRIAQAPKPGQDIRLTREQLLKALRYESPVLASQVQWEGAEAVLVSASGQSPDLAPIRRVAEEALRKALLTKVHDVNVQMIELASKPMLPPGPITIKAISIKPDNPARRMVVEIEFSAGGQHRRVLPVWFTVQAKVDVLVAKADIISGSVIDITLFDKKRVELGDVRQPIDSHFTTHERLRARQNIASGSVLTQANVEPAPPINRQQEVAVQLFADGIALKTSGIALSDGEIGKPIRVKNPRTGEVFSAMVSAPGVATITVR